MVASYQSDNVALKIVRSQTRILIQGSKQVFKSTELGKFKNFSNTERKLAEIWKNVLFLSAQKYYALHKTSDFFEFVGWCATHELADLKQQIEYTFKISTEPFALDDYSTLSAQAALIDRIILHKENILFLSSWIKEVYCSSTDSSIKEASLKQIPAEYQTSLRELLAQSSCDIVLIRDIDFSCVENSSLLNVVVRVELCARKGAALITTQRLNLLFMLEVADNSEPKILSLQHSPIA